MPVFPRITKIAYALPAAVVRNAEIAAQSKWTADDILKKTGISERHIAGANETAADLAVLAARQIIGQDGELADIDLLVFCTQSPDYALPPSACLIQNRLGLSTHCAAFDFNLGCSGYIYGLAIVQSMLRAGVARKGLLLTGETYSKWFAREDVSVAAIFGDAGTATLVECTESPDPAIGPFLLGTDGTGARRLIVGGSGARPMTGDPLLAGMPADDSRRKRLFMDGPEIFAFTTRAVPSAIAEYFSQHRLSWDDFDHVVFHQANRFMLEHLRRQCRIPEEKFVYCLELIGNTVSNTIPIALAELQQVGKLQTGHRLLLVGFGVGYSWGICTLRWA